MKSFEEVKPHLSRDGVLRDIYIKDTTEADLVNFLDYVATSYKPRRFVIDGEERPVPGSYQKIKDLIGDCAVCLGASVCGAIVNNHFFIEEEIELDFRPEEFSTPDAWHCLSQFLEGLTERLQKNAIVTHENSPELVICEFEPKQPNKSA